MLLLKPSEEYLESYYQGCLETWGHAYDDYIIHDPREYPIWKNEIFRRYVELEKGIGLPEGFVPSVTYWAVVGGEYAGTVNIRPKLNDGLREFGGHVGFIIRKSMRGKGYCRKIIKLALQECRKLVSEDIILCCDTSNVRAWSALDSLHEFGELQYLARQVYRTRHGGEDIEAVKFLYSHK